LRYLTDEPQTPAQLARRLRLRPPTVIHHLDALRLARLVHITLTEEGKQYAARPGAVNATFALLDEFLTTEGEDGLDGAGGDTDFAS
jgi:DNA-binding transcriptional ArsR family regulator